MTKKELIIALDAVPDDAKLLLYDEYGNVFYTSINSFSRINDAFIINVKFNKATDAIDANSMFNQLAFELPTTE